MDDDRKTDESVEHDEIFKSRTFFISGRAIDLMEQLRAKLGWSQHEIVTRAIEILWEQDKQVEGQPEKERPPHLSLLVERLLKRIGGLERRVDELERKNSGE